VALRFQQLGREHHVTILLSFALLHTNYHPLAIDIVGPVLAPVREFTRMAAEAMHQPPI
jgi:hypothetical protein